MIDGVLGGGIDALQGAVAVLASLYPQNTLYKQVTSQVPGITRIEGGTNTNVVLGKVMFKLDGRMIPEEHSAEVEASIRDVIDERPRRCPASRGDQALAAGVA